MDIQLHGIDGGNPFDFGKTSADYAKYRDIYPPQFYQALTGRRLCVKGQRVLDLGTGTGVLPRFLYHTGAEFVGTDISAEQIAEAKRLAAEQQMQITFLAAPAEALPFPEGSFDVITACQCFWYFDHAAIAPKLAGLLKPGGRLAVLQMEWLPFEDDLAMASESLVLQYNPGWTGGGYHRAPVWIPEDYAAYFEPESAEQFDLHVPFTRESWHGRMRACRGVGASLTGEKLAEWEHAHMAMLMQKAPESFTVLHEGAIAVLRRKDLTE
ncbi:MAG: class I SAM-dependent methyltransferase [Oscillospiraceae bacterium]|nr:class I SAM-dependent methyltransferase [Oscillospiraceae bacterium]